MNLRVGKVIGKNCSTCLLSTGAMRVGIACDDGTFMFPKECPKGFSAKRLRGGKMCDFYKVLGVILRVFYHLSDFFIALLSRKRAAKRRHRDSRFKQSFAFRSLCFRRCCLYAANSGTGQLAVRVSHATLLSLRSNIPRSFSSFAANNNSRSYSAVF